MHHFTVHKIWLFNLLDLTYHKVPLYMTISVEFSSVSRIYLNMDNFYKKFEKFNRTLIWVSGNTVSIRKVKRFFALRITVNLKYFVSFSSLLIVKRGNHLIRINSYEKDSWHPDYNVLQIIKIRYHRVISKFIDNSWSIRDS